jgi:hypothetical protein
LIRNNSYRSQDICIVLAGNARLSTRCIQIVDLVLQLTNLFGLLINQTILLYQSTNSSPLLSSVSDKDMREVFSLFHQFDWHIPEQNDEPAPDSDTSHTRLLPQHHQTRHAANEAKGTTHQPSTDRCYAIEIA